jgi:galactokinase
MRAPERAVAGFRTRWGAEPPLLARAPGRVNLIGDHTDYNDGFVLPMAIDREVWIALRPRADRRVKAISESDPRPVGLTVDAGGVEAGWGAYLQGVSWALREADLPVQGWDGFVASDVPVGAGLSSSAALELAAAMAFLAGAERRPGLVDLARLAQRAENDWVGVSCGIMDQLVVAAGRAGHALLIDCRTLEARPVPLPAGVAVLVLDTTTRRDLVASAYNQRRRECEQAARVLGVAALRDVDAADVARHAERLGHPLVGRARHVVTENDRTRRAAEALGRGDVRTTGSLMAESHVSLRDDFEVSSDALDAIVDAAAVQPGCHGARMTGAGFGGCAVALVDGSAAERVAEAAAGLFRTETGHDARVLVCAAAAGAEVLRTA